MRSTYISKNIDVDVDIDLDDVITFVQECNEDETIEIRKEIKGITDYEGFEVNTVYDKTKLDIVKRLYDNFNCDELENMLSLS